MLDADKSRTRSRESSRSKARKRSTWALDRQRSRQTQRTGKSADILRKNKQAPTHGSILGLVARNSEAEELRSHAGPDSRGFKHRRPHNTTREKVESHSSHAITESKLSNITQHKTEHELKMRRAQEVTNNRHIKKGRPPNIRHYKKEKSVVIINNIKKRL